MNETITIQVPLLTKPDQVSRNGLVFSKEVIVDAINKAINRPEGLYLVIRPKVLCDSPYSRGYCSVDINYAIGRIKHYDSTTNCLRVDIDPDSYINTILFSDNKEIRLTAAIRGVGSLDENRNIQHDFKLICVDADFEFSNK